MGIIRDDINGERCAAILTAHRDISCKKSEKTITAALTGNYRDEHIFALKQAVELYEFHQERIRNAIHRLRRPWQN